MSDKISEERPFFYMRPMEKKDFLALKECAFASHAGMTSLPKNDDRLTAKLALTVESFQKNVAKPHRELYLFVLEHADTGRIAGLSGIQSCLGVDKPAYFYEIVDETIPDPLPFQPPSQKLLKAVALTEGASELCSLFLLKDWREKKLGTLLSLSRFLFIALNPHRFRPTLVAELRGYLDDEGDSPFWESIGKKFLDVPFNQIELERANDDSFIPRMMPRHPVYISLLNETAKDSIGLPHRSSLPALNMLEKQGFKTGSLIDPFDGGPILSGEIEAIDAINKIEKRSLTGFCSDSEGVSCLVANNSPFRVVATNAFLDKDGEVHLTQSAAKNLNASLNDALFLLPLTSET